MITYIDELSPASSIGAQGPGDMLLDFKKSQAKSGYAISFIVVVEAQQLLSVVRLWSLSSQRQPEIIISSDPKPPDYIMGRPCRPMVVHVPRAPPAKYEKRCQVSRQSIILPVKSSGN